MSRKSLPIVAAGALLLAATCAAAQGTTDVFTGTATLKAASGATASAPVRITGLRTTPQDELDRLTAVFKKEGAKGLRKALAKMPSTGSVQLGNGQAVPTRITIERATPKGRVLTMVTDTPVIAVGAGLPDAKPKEGYDFGVIRLEVDATGRGSGTIAGAAKITTGEQGSFVADDYSADPIRISGTLRRK